MASSLKEKATKKKSSSLGSKMKSSPGKEEAQTIETNAPEKEPQPNIVTPTFNAAPPLPPALAYLGYIASIPGVRKRERGY